MKVVLVASAGRKDPLLPDSIPGSMLPVMGRPLIQHVIEAIVRLGHRHLDIVLSQAPAALEEFVGDGGRFGVTVRFHLVRDADHPWSVMSWLLAGAGGEVLLAAADRLPQVDLAATRPEDGFPLVYCDFAGRFTGWAWAPARALASVAPDVDEHQVAVHLLAAKARVHHVQHVLSVASVPELIAAQRVASAAFKELVLDGREPAPGVRLARGARIHPSAEVVPPVYAGEGSRVLAGARIGPNASIGAGCIVDEGSVVAEAVVLPGSYVGRDIEVRWAVVDGDHLASASAKTAMVVADPAILGSISAPSFARAGRRLLDRALGVLLAVVTLPVLAATALYLKLFRDGPVFVARDVVRLPASPDDSSWRTVRVHGLRPPGGPLEWQADSAARDFLLRFVPGLLDVVAGRVRLVGMPARTREELEALPADWRALYLQREAGLVTEALAAFPDASTEEDLWAAECYHAAKASFLHDLRLGFLYARRVLRSLRSHRPAVGAEPEPRTLKP